jgi:pyruvate dehydrogenase E1 component alpha subunit
MTPSYETTSNATTSQRGASFGMPAVVVDGNDIEAVFLEVEKAVNRARSGGGPTYIEAMTYRLWGHMMGDPEVYRSKEEVAKARENEPIIRLGDRLVELGYTQNQLKDLENQAQMTIESAVSFAENSPAPNTEEALLDVFSAKP